MFVDPPPTAVTKPFGLVLLTVATLLTLEVQVEESVTSS
jgi:hypothetical protein